MGRTHQMNDDPTRPLYERSQDQIGEFIDEHIISALNAAHWLYPIGDSRAEAEDYVRNRLVALSDSWNTRESLSAEESRLRLARIRRAISKRTGEL